MIELLTFFCRVLSVSVHAMPLPDPAGLNHAVSINQQFANGSRELAKQYVEVYQSGRTAILRDFKELEIHGAGKPQRKKVLKQEKGQARMVRAFIERIRAGGEPLIAFEEIVRVTRGTLATLESIKVRWALGV